jgi:hypothetical protein
LCKGIFTTPSAHIAKYVQLQFTCEGEEEEERIVMKEKIMGGERERHRERRRRVCVCVWL